MWRGETLCVVNGLMGWWVDGLMGWLVLGKLGKLDRDRGREEVWG